jgi:AraC family transcriptional regulator
VRVQSEKESDGGTRTGPARQGDEAMATIITPSEVPKYVPGAVTAASDDLGWNGVLLRGYRYTGLDVIVPPVRDFTIVSYLRGATFMERRCEGAWTRTHCAPGDVSLLTRSQRSHWHWTEEIDVSHVYLSENLVSGICAEITGRCLADVRLHDVLKSHDPTVTAAVAAVTREARQQALGGPLYVEAVATQLAVHLLRNYASVTFPEPTGKGRLSPAQIRRLTEYIDSRLREQLNLETLAAVVGVGMWTFTRHFRESFGRTPHAYIIERRIDCARRLLAQTNLPIKEVASMCGFADQAHMTRAFQTHLRATPAMLRH